MKQVMKGMLRVLLPLCIAMICFAAMAVTASADDVIQLGSTYAFGETVNFGENTYIRTDDQFSSSAKKNASGEYELEYEKYVEDKGQHRITFNLISSDATDNFTVCITDSNSAKPFGIKVKAGDGSYSSPFEIEVLHEKLVIRRGDKYAVGATINFGNEYVYIITDNSNNSSQAFNREKTLTYNEYISDSHKHVFQINGTNVYISDANNAPPYGVKVTGGSGTSESPFELAVLRECTASFVGGEAGGDDPVTMTALTGEAITLPANTFTAPAGKVFAGWNDGTDTFPSGESYILNANTDFSAQWVTGYLIPKSGSDVVNLSELKTGESISVYDAGGLGGNYENDSDGCLFITPPEGKALRITGKIATEENFDYFYLYGGSTDNEIKKISGTDENVDVSTADRSVIFKLESDGSTNKAGVELTVTVIDCLTVTYAPNGGTGTMELGTVLPGDAFTLPACGFTPPTGKAFSGWLSGVDGSICQPGDSVTLTESATFTAQWADGAVVTFDSNGGSDVKTQYVLLNSCATEPTPSRAGYGFLYWTKDGSEFDFSTPITEDITLLALWSPSGTIVINDGTSTNNCVPIYGFDVDRSVSSQFIIPAEQLEFMGKRPINQMIFYANKDSVDWGSAEFEIYMTEVSDTTLSAPVDWDGMTLVRNSAGLSVSGGKMVVSLDTPYDYRGGNLLIGFKQTQSGNYVFSLEWYGVSAKGASFGGSASLNQRDFLPKISFDFGSPHTHSWTYTANGATITAACTGIAEGVCLEPAETLTILAPKNLATDGQPKPATLSISGSQRFTGTYTIVYKQGATELDGAPTEAGTYTASVTAEGVTAEVEYQLSPAAIAATVTANDRTYDGTEQPLVTVNESTLDGGEMQYALGTDADTAPTDGWETTIPTATAARTYYVWYKAVGDAFHADTDPQPLTVTIRSLFSGHSLSLDGDIGVNFYLNITEQQAENATVTFTWKKNGTDKTETVSWTAAENPYDGKATCRVSASEMSTEITATLTVNNGQSEQIRETDKYSVAQYVDVIKNNSDFASHFINQENENGKDGVQRLADLKNLVDAMLAYGDHAHAYFDENAAVLDTPNVVIPDTVPASETTNLPSGVTFEGATLSLRSKTSLSLYFKKDAGVSDVVLTMEGKIKDVDYETDSSGDEYVIRIRNIAAAELNKSVTVTVNGTGSVTYSPLTYCYKAQQTSSNTKLVNTVKALYSYWLAADKFF